MHSKLLSALLLLLIGFNVAAQLNYREDLLKQGFECATIEMPDDYDGKVITTLIRKIKPGNTRAALYVHGFSDYFFQAEMADQYLDHGFDFYALDLRKYGRSHLPHQRLFDVRNIHEYDADIDTALRVIKQAGYPKIVLNGHSTGGLIIACYAHRNKGKEFFDAMVMNSPFFDMNQNWFTEHITVPVGSFWGAMFPRAIAPGGISPYYGYSIHRSYYGEWTFDTAWKPIVIPPVNFGWVRAIHKAHKEVQKGNVLNKPCLVMRSGKSVYGKSWHTDFSKGDAVLDVEDIDKYGRRLGPETKVIIIENGLHDLTLSSGATRNKMYEELFSWLQSTLP